MKKIILITLILIILVLAGIFVINKWGYKIITGTIKIYQQNQTCISEGKEIYGEAPVVHQCCPGLKMIGAIDDKGNRIYDVAYCTKCGDSICKKPENKYNCPDDCNE